MGRTATTPARATTYRIKAFAERANVTVRALHHYDRLGLLKPGHRTDAGYRLYTDRDLIRLEQIVVLKFLGIPLVQIRRWLVNESRLGDMLGQQRRVLGAKRRQLDAAMAAIARAEAAVASESTPDWSLFARIIKEIAMQDETNWSQKYYSDAAKVVVEEGRARWTPEIQAEVSAKWAALIADVTAAMKSGADPASPVAQALATRWRALVGEFTGGSKEVQKGLNAMWADQANWPTAQREHYGIDPAVQAFIERAMKP